MLDEKTNNIEKGGFSEKKENFETMNIIII